MKSIYIYWDYPKYNGIILWTLIDQFKATYNDIKIHCSVNSDILSLCNVINDESLKFYPDIGKEKKFIFNILESSNIDLALLFHCSDDLINLFNEKNVDSFVISNKLKTDLNIFDNLQDPLENIIKKIAKEFKLKKIKPEKNLYKLKLKNQIDLKLNHIDSDYLVNLIDVSGINENIVIAKIIINFIKELVKDKQNYIVLIGATNYKNLQELEIDNCINYINKVHFFQSVNLVKNIDVFIGKKGFVSDFFCLKNKMVIEIATPFSKSFIRNRVSSLYNVIANLKNSSCENQIELKTSQLISQFDQLVKNYNLNIKTNSKNYYSSCFIQDNPILFIFSSQNECAEFINSSELNYLNYYSIDKWNFLNCIKISQIINQCSINIIIGAIPVRFELIIRVLEWIKSVPSKLTFIKVPFLNQFSILDHISNTSFYLKNKQL